MFRTLVACLVMALPMPALADRTDTILDQHVLPGFAELAASSQALSEAAQSECQATAVPLRDAYTHAFDAWIRVSHLRFGPTERDNRGFALAFWPDSRSSTPKTLTALIHNEDPIVTDPKAFPTVSIAGRGFYAMEYLLCDPRLSTLGDDAYRCALIQAIAQDIATTSRDVDQDWRQTYVALMKTPEPGGVYQSEAEVLQEFYKALDTGLQINADLRLGRPLGTFDKPRPKRAEVWRSDRSLRHLQLSLEQLRQLVRLLAADDTDLAQRLDAKFDVAQTKADALNDPAFAGVATPAGRFRIEVLQQAVNGIRTEVTQSLGPALGVSVGFNSLDGD